MNPIIEEWRLEVEATNGAMESATVFINGSAARLEGAVAAALDKGATEEQLAPIAEEIAFQKAKRDEMAAAIAANS